uniref:uncharacterized protein LOC113474275 n=1 Tax=Ciona intestinalis TaxID=7719 RepID=UPI000EF482BE|nr:uncharacterized protein LOC113474275 [Ciona intestinalis]|eukprot:XP_026690498.1 uncharacterized protein LOC113474275 [Ciona intestinalis]
MDGFFFENAMEKAGLQPWWEKVRQYFAKLMVVVSVYVITSVKYDEVRCVPFSMNTTTGIPDGTRGYGPAQAAFVNAQCAAVLPVFFRIFGILLVGYSAYGFLIDSYWLMNPTVINAINEAKLAISENKEFKTEVRAMRLYLKRSCCLIIYLIAFATIVIVELIIHLNIFNFECSIAQKISHSIAGQYSCNFPNKELVEFIAVGMILILSCQFVIVQKVCIILLYLYCKKHI